MIEDIVHIKAGRDRRSHCGVNLFGGQAALFVQSYKPDRVCYPICRIINVEAAYPIFEQVQVVEHVEVCEDCLSDLGMSLLISVENFVYSN
jgi:hypothetical protein